MTDQAENADEDVVVRQQNEISIFLNTGGGITISERNPDDGKQIIVLTGRQAVRTVIKRLTILARELEG